MKLDKNSLYILKKLYETKSKSGMELSELDSDKQTYLETVYGNLKVQQKGSKSAAP